MDRSTGLDAMVKGHGTSILLQSGSYMKSFIHERKGGGGNVVLCSRTMFKVIVVLFVILNNPEAVVKK